MSTISINLSEPVSAILNMITEMIKMINHIKEREIQQISIERSMLYNESKTISTKHKVLARQIFYPLYQNIIVINISENETNLPMITFTASQVRDSLHHDDGLEHLEQSIPGFLSRFTGIEDRVKAYNIDLRDFYDRRIKDYISDYIEENGFKITYNSNTDIPPNTINLSNLLPEFNRYWNREIEDVAITRHGNSMDVYIMGHAVIATVSSDDEENRVRNLVNELKELDKIKIELEKFYQVIIGINNTAEGLSKDIGKNIIRLVELEEYDSKCKICKTSDVP
jgi:hypothetical protein